MIRYWSSNVQRAKQPVLKDSANRFSNGPFVISASFSGYISRALKFSQTVFGALPNIASRSSSVNASNTSTSLRYALSFSR